MIDGRPPETESVDSRWLENVLSLRPGEAFTYRGKQYTRSDSGVRDIVLLIARVQGFEFGLLALRQIFVSFPIEGDVTWDEVRSDFEKLCVDDGIAIPFSDRKTPNRN